MKRILIPLSVLLVGVATAVKAFNNEVASKPDSETVSLSVDEARLGQVFVERLIPEPSTIEVDGQRYPIREAWVEKRSDRAYVLIWFSYRKVKPGYKVVLRAEDPSLQPAFNLWLPESRRSFGQRKVGGARKAKARIFHEAVYKLPSGDLMVEVRPEKGNGPVQQLRLRRVPQPVEPAFEETSDASSGD